MAKSDKLFISLYKDYYGKMLTGRQREVIELYYDMDCSLNEIAEQYGISRQAVRESIVSAENVLTKLEENIGAAAKTRRITVKLSDIADRAIIDGADITAERIRKLIENIEEE